MDELWFSVIEIFIFDCKEKKKSEKWWKTFEQLGKDFWPIKRRKTGGACGQTKKWKRFMKSRTRYAGGLHSWITYKEWNKTEYPRNHPWGKGRRKRGRPRLSWLWMTWKRTKGIGCENMETGGPEHGKQWMKVVAERLVFFRGSSFNQEEEVEECSVSIDAGMLGFEPINLLRKELFYQYYVNYW